MTIKVSSRMLCCYVLIIHKNGSDISWELYKRNLSFFSTWRIYRKTTSMGLLIIESISGFNKPVKTIRYFLSYAPYNSSYQKFNQRIKVRCELFLICLCYSKFCTIRSNVRMGSMYVTFLYTFSFLIDTSSRIL